MGSLIKFHGVIFDILIVCICAIAVLQSFIADDVSAIRLGSSKLAEATLQKSEYEIVLFIDDADSSDDGSGKKKPGPV